MVSTHQHVGHGKPAILGRPRVAGRADAAIVKRIGARTLQIAHGPRQQPHGGIDDGQCRRLAAAQHKVAERNLFGGQVGRDALVHVFVVAAEQRELGAGGKAHRIGMRKAAPAR